MNGSVRIWAGLIEGPYPAYEGLIPSEYVGTVAVPKGALCSAVARIGALSKGRRPAAVALEVEGSQLVLRLAADAGDGIGAVERVAPARITGTVPVCALRINYLSDALARLPDVGVGGVPVHGRQRRKPGGDSRVADRRTRDCWRWSCPARCDWSSFWGASPVHCLGVDRGALPCRSALKGAGTMEHEEGLCVGCSDVTTNTVDCNCTRAVFACGSCCESDAPLRCATCRERAAAPGRVPVSGLSGRPGSRPGHGRLPARGGGGRRVGASVACRLTARTRAGGRTAGLQTRLRAATACSGAGLTGAPRRPALRALRSALVGVQPTTVYGPRPSGPGKAAASSRIALPLRRASVVTSAKRTATRSERASDDAATGSRLPAEVVGTQRRTQLFGVALPARWSGARWCQGSTVRFSSENLLRSDDRRQQAEIRNGGLLWKLGGCCIPALW